MLATSQFNYIYISLNIIQKVRYCFYMLLILQI